MKLYCAWSSFLQNWDRRIINKIYYYYCREIRWPFGKHITDNVDERTVSYKKGGGSWAVRLGGWGWGGKHPAKSFQQPVQQIHGCFCFNAQSTGKVVSGQTSPTGVYS